MDFKGKKLYLLFICVAFIILCLFYIQYHPLYIYDTDDWTYIAYSRLPLPSLKYYNPIKVLPETLLPLTAQAGISLFLPMNGDYIESMSWAFTFVLVIFILFYILSYKRILETFHLDNPSQNIFILAIILLVHYFVYNDGEYFFHGSSVNVIFNYLIPTLLNAGLIIRIIFNNANINKPINNFEIGVFILGVYLSIFSNLWQSIILTAGVSATLIVEFVVFSKSIKDNWKNVVIEFIKLNYARILIVGCWLISLLFEVNGSRAHAIGTHPLYLKEAVVSFIDSLSKINLKTALCFMLITISAVIVGLYSTRHNKYDNTGILFLKFILIGIISLGITLLYLILLSSKTGVGYLRTIDLMNVWVFWAILISSLSLIYLLLRFKRINKLLILSSFILFISAYNGGEYKQNYLVNYNPQIVKELDENIINQVLVGESEGLTEIEVKVPYYNSSDGWPIANYGGDRISNTLYRHDLTKKKLKIILVPDKTINDKYGI